ncbi:MAG: amidohydrolase family protein, partial [Bacteroidales bacterium]
AYQTLQLATVNGAKTLGLENKLGILKEGALADVILIDLNRPHLYPQFDLITHLVYSARSEDVDTVIVDGNIVVDNRILLTADLEEVCREVEMRAKKIAMQVSQN